MNKSKRDMKKLVESDDDFIYYPRLDNSLKKFIEKNPDGVDNNKISKVLLMSEEEIEEAFNSAIKKIRDAMGIDKE
jgi:hypothetical protein